MRESHRKHCKSCTKEDNESEELILLRRSDITAQRAFKHEDIIIRAHRKMCALINLIYF